MNAPINHIIDQSVVDGPGNRSVIFFQGCNFNCKYCHNPETINTCSSCLSCITACNYSALTMKNGVINWNEALCQKCDMCIQACQHDSSPRVILMPPETIIKRIKCNLPFIRGITISGGECSLYRDFIVILFKKARALGLSTIIDSNGSYDFSSDAELLDQCDSVILDIKCFDNKQHINLTGQSNTVVLNNALFLAKQHKLSEIRTVVIPDELPNEETVTEITALLSPYLSQSDICYKLIMFRKIGVRKPYLHFQTPPNQLMLKLQDIAKQNGFFNCVIV